MTFLDDALGDRPWVEVARPDFDPALAILLARNRADGLMRPLGSGFIVQADRQRALIATAAHVVDQISRYQGPVCRAHPTALPDFLPEPREIELEHRDLLVITGTNQGPIRPVRVTGLRVFRDCDVGLVMVAPQNEEREEFTHRLATVALPFAVNCGDAVAVFSNAELGGIDERAGPGNGDRHLRLERLPTVRIGRIIAIHAEGTMLNRAPCVETTIPVTEGMSGGAAFVVDDQGTLRAFGVISASSDTEATGIDGSVLAFLPPQAEEALPGGAIAMTFHGDPKLAIGELADPTG